MKKKWSIVAALCFAGTLSFSSIQAEAAAPKVTYKTYKDPMVRYAVISGSKYKSVNAKMYKEAKQTYAVHKELQKESKDYSAGQSCEAVYRTTKKVSILCDYHEYTGGAHPNHGFAAYSTYNGKLITLKKAFKSDKDYKAGKKYAKNYILSRPNKYRLADKSSTIAGHTYLWTKKGIEVVFSPYEIGPYSDGMLTVPVPQKYLKY